jgi:hypothetical protein
VARRRRCGAGTLGLIIPTIPITFFQSASLGTHGTPGPTVVPWSVEQIHDTVAKIAARPIYNGSARQSLLGRFLHYLGERFLDFLGMFAGTIDARTALVVAGLVVGGVIVARMVVLKQIHADERLHGRGPRIGAGGRIDHWALAREEAAAGRFAQASHAIYSAVIDTLGREGAMKVHSSKTSGDYARDLRRAGYPGVADFRSFAREFDRTVFGETHVGAADFARLREAAERAARRTASA